MIVIEGAVYFSFILCLYTYDVQIVYILYAYMYCICYSERKYKVLRIERDINNVFTIVFGLFGKRKKKKKRSSCLYSILLMENCKRSFIFTFSMLLAASKKKNVTV